MRRGVDAIELKTQRSRSHRLIVSTYRLVHDMETRQILWERPFVKASYKNPKGSKAA